MTSLAICPLSTTTTLTVGGCQEYQVDTTSASFTITLPDATVGDGIYLIFKRFDNSIHTCTLACQASQTIDGAGTLALGQRAHYHIMSYSGKWYIVG